MTSAGIQSRGQGRRFQLEIGGGGEVTNPAILNQLGNVIASQKYGIGPMFYFLLRINSLTFIGLLM